MLRSMTDLNGYAVRAADGNIGQVRDCYFDDESWSVPFLVVDTGTWLTSRKVLISPRSIGRANWEQKVLPVGLTREQVRNSPHIDAGKLVSREHEREFLGYYGYSPLPQVVREDSQLRSCRTMPGHRIMATDGEIGHVETLLIDEQDWTVVYMVVKTGPVWGGYLVLIAPRWIRDACWPDCTLTVDLDRQTVREVPPYSGRHDDSVDEIMAARVAPRRPAQSSVLRRYG